ncbi:MAG: hypothetical protein V2B13_10900, partial [Pseudomonadota bacterium]
MKKENGTKPDISCETEEDVTLLDFLIVLLKHKWLVIFCVLIATAIAVSHISYTNLKSSKITAPPDPIAAPAPIIFRSICTITPVDLDGNGIISILKKIELSQVVVQKNNLLPLLFPHLWDEKNNKWLSEKPPSLRDGYNQLQGSLSIKSINPSNEMELSYEDTNTERAQKILNCIIEGAKEYLEQQFQEKQKRVLEIINLQKKYLSRQVANTSDPALKKALADHLAKFIPEEIIEINWEYQGFKIVFLSSSPEIKPPAPAPPPAETKQAEAQKPKMKPSSPMKPANLIFLLIVSALMGG